MGRPDIWAKLVGVGLVFMFPLLWVAGPMGLMPFTVARFAGAAALPILNILVTARVLGVSIQQQLKIYVVPFVAALVMFILVGLFLRMREPLNGLDGWLSLLASIIIGAGVYGGLVWWFRRAVVLQIVKALRRAMVSS
jgi:heme/copper-type cytochrome/quinol oxidase subunit 4